MTQETLIIGISGKKQSGKTSLCQFIQSWYAKQFMPELEVTAEQDEYGNVVYRKTDGTLYDGVPKPLKDDCAIFNFADPLKDLICRRVLGLSYGQTSGTDEQKNSLTPYSWERMPNGIAFRYSEEWVSNGDPESMDFGGLVKVPRTGFMTAREIMQVVGTDIFRQCFTDSVWVDAAFNCIDEDKPKVALIADVRFSSEVDSIIERGGHVIRLERRVSDDNHPSETELDDYDFASSGRCHLIGNAEQTMEEKNQDASNVLRDIFDSAAKM